MGSPLYAFKEIGGVQLQANVQEIPQLNSTWKDSEYTDIEVSPISLSRGVQIGDSSFYNWFRNSVTGKSVSRHNLLLVQYTGVALTDDIASVFPSPLVGDIKFIPGRAWMLWKCKPIQYQAFDGFSGENGDISVMQIDVQPLAIEEFVLPTLG